MSEEIVWCVQEWWWNASFGKDDQGEPRMQPQKSMPQVWFGSNAKERALKYLKEYAKLNNMSECNPCWNKYLAYRSRLMGEGKQEWFQCKQMFKLIDEYCVNIEVVDE